MPSKAIGHELVDALEEIDPRVVVVDDGADLLDDRPADRGDALGPVHPGRRRLDDRHLGGPRLEVLEQLGVPEGQRDVDPEGGHDLDVLDRPLARGERGGRQRADEASAVDERDEDVAAHRQATPEPILPAVRREGLDVIADPGAAGREGVAEPWLVDRERRQGGRGIVVEAGPADELEELAAERPEQDHVGPGEGPRRVHDGPLEVLPVERGGQPLGHLQERSVALGSGRPARRHRPEARVGDRQVPVAPAPQRPDSRRSGGIFSFDRPHARGSVAAGARRESPSPGAAGSSPAHDRPAGPGRRPAPARVRRGS